MCLGRRYGGRDTRTQWQHELQGKQKGAPLVFRAVAGVEGGVLDIDRVTEELTQVTKTPCTHPALCTHTYLSRFQIDSLVRCV